MDNMPTPATITWPSLEDFPQKSNDQPSNNPFEIFANPFEIEDLLVFDDATLQRMLKGEAFHITIEDLGYALHSKSEHITNHIKHNLSSEAQDHFHKALNRILSEEEVKDARKRILDNLFWELIYWKMPEWYDELTEGEYLHPAIFASLKEDIYGRVALDVASGTGRATLEALRYEPERIYAVDPSPGVISVLEKKLAHLPAADQVIIRPGSFEQLPLEDNSIDIAFTCSAFSAEAGRGGELGLAEFWRVTRSGGKIVIIWPSPLDYLWLANHGFEYIRFPTDEHAVVRFRSLDSALRCAQLFYAKNEVLINYLLEQENPEVAYSLLGFPQPNDYCWLRVHK